MAAQAEAERLPPVPKRLPADPGFQARAAKAAARPKTAARGSVLCPYCSQWLPSSHQENCPRMPFELWREATRRRQLAKFGAEVVAAWPVQCQHCALPFPAPASKRVHLSGCERRRIDAELPLNQYPVVRQVAP